MVGIYGILICQKSLAILTC